MWFTGSSGEPIGSKGEPIGSSGEPIGNNGAPSPSVMCHSMLPFCVRLAVVNWLTSISGR